MEVCYRFRPRDKAAHLAEIERPCLVDMLDERVMHLTIFLGLLQRRLVMDILGHGLDRFQRVDRKLLSS